MDVTEILEAHKAQFKPITVEKAIPLDFDVNILSAFDTNAFDEKRLKSDLEDYIKQLTRDNTQLLINEIFKLPAEMADAGVLAKLPERVSQLPREKPLPKDKPLTRWEKFAKAKGIQNRKRERFAWDEEKQKYVPQWGYSGGQKDKADDWLIEVPQHADPMEDQYAKKREEKKERVDKNKKRQRRNEEEGAAAKMAGKSQIRDFKKDELKAAIAAAKTATASQGKFDQEAKPFDKKKKKTNTPPKKKPTNPKKATSKK